MQLRDLVKPIHERSDEELLARLREIRHNREVVRPAAKKHIERAEKKETKAKGSTLDKALGALSAQEMAELIKQLESGT